MVILEGAYQAASNNRLFREWYNLHPENIEELSKINPKNTTDKAAVQKIGAYSNIAIQNRDIGIAEFMSGFAVVVGAFGLAYMQPEILAQGLKSIGDFIAANNYSPEAIYAATTGAAYALFVGPTIAMGDGVTRFALNNEEGLQIVIDRNIELKKRYDEAKSEKRTTSS